MQGATKGNVGNLNLESSDDGAANSQLYQFSDGAVFANIQLSAQAQNNEHFQESSVAFNLQTLPLGADEPRSSGESSRRSSLTLELTDVNRVHREIQSCVSRINPDFARPLEKDLSDSHIRQTPPLHDTSFDGCHISSVWKPRGLTLSAFRRPENTIRLTKSDQLRRLDSMYDFHCPGASGVLGHGAYSTVRLAMRLSDGVRVAVKSIAKHEALRSRRLRRVDDSGVYKNYMEEWEILRRLHDHPYVITLIDVFETSEEIQLVTEYCQGGELFDAIQKNQRRHRQSVSRTEKQAALITSQILQALATLHALGIVHRDVKPENILLAKPLGDDSVHVKLCDFGVARPLVPNEVVEERSDCVISDGEASPLTPGSRTRSFSSVGTDYYAAPELTYANSYDTAVDVYSLGVTLYILLCGFPPVFGATEPILPGGISDDDESETATSDEILFPGVLWNEISPNAKSLLKQMLHPNPSRRINAIDAQLDPWIQSWINDSSLKFFIGTPKNAPVDLNMVRHELYKSMIGLPRQQQISSRLKRRNSTFIGQIANSFALPKRARTFGDTVSRVERRSSTTALMALADLYRGVAAPSVMAAAAVAAASNTDNITGIHDSDNPQESPSIKGTTDIVVINTKSPVAALSF